MSPLIDRQMRTHQIGEIRLGRSVETKDGKKRAERLETIRFTTTSKTMAEAVAATFGGKLFATKLLNGKETYDIQTNLKEVEVIIPPGENIISQWYEMWPSAAGLARRCNGATEQLTQTPCKCPADLDLRKEKAKTAQACKPTTRLSLMIPGLPDIGTWLLRSTGDMAADELNAFAETLRGVRASGVYLRATLGLRLVEKRRAGKPAEKWVVPWLQLANNVAEIKAMAEGIGIAAALPEPEAPVLTAIGTGDSQAYEAQTQREVDDVVDAELVDDEEHGEKVTEDGMQVLADARAVVGLNKPADWVRFANGVLGRSVASTETFTETEWNKLMDAMEELQ